jgi:predicted glycoside hydrolase/deacetylase ChbG (UPF0249 family)
MNKIPARKILALIYLILFMLIIYFIWNRDGEIRLIVRGDDMGFSHSSNMGCIEAYQNGILTAVEVMVPGEYFSEAVTLLKENPDLDVGIHLTLNNEWENIKWGPLTKAPSLVDESGHFFAMTWPDDAYSPQQALGTANWQLDEIENELRAQIEKILHYLPDCSHATPHMGFHTISPEIYNVTFNLMKEYNLDANIRILPLKQLWLFGDSFEWQEMASHAVSVLEDLGSGTYETYDHPGMIIEGEEMAWHIGAENDGLYRAAVTKALTDKRLRDVIDRRGIQLIGYRDLQFWH